MIPWWWILVDTPSRIALCAGVLTICSVLLLTLLRRPFFPRTPHGERITLAAVAGAAVLGSLAYFVFYVRGSPRIIDASTYWLEARALATGTGHFVFPAPDPSASYRGRFLLFRDGHLGGIFPPGWPLLLSVGELK